MMYNRYCYDYRNGGQMDTLALIFIGSWSFVIIFFSAVIAPTVFSAVDEKNAGLFLRAFFPKYYYFGIFLGTTSLFLLPTELENAPDATAMTASVLLSAFGVNVAE